MTPKTVFLIDDDIEDLEFMQYSLHQVDSSIICTSFIMPEEALRILTKEQSAVPDYIFVDMNMPKINGEECLLELRKQLKLSGTRIIMYSTSMHKDMAEKLRQLGADYTFAKPNSEEEYAVLLKKVIFGDTIANKQSTRKQS